MITLKETNEDATINGIFHSLQSSAYFDWLTSQMAIDLDMIYYLNYSGDKYISPMFTKLLESDTDSALKKLSSIINTMFGANWNRLYNVYLSESYNPLYDYNVSEIESQSSKITTDIKQDRDIYAFNSEDSSPADTNDSHQIITGNADDNVKKVTKEGLIGFKTPQRMLSEEIELRKWNFYSRLFKDVDSLLCLKIY